MEQQLYQLTLLVSGIVNLLIAIGLIHGNCDYHDYSIYRRSRLLTALSLAVFGAGFLLHWHFGWRTTWPLGATALSVTYFHLGGTFLFWSHVSLLRPDYLRPRVMIRESIALILCITTLWLGAIYNVFQFVCTGIVIFLLHVTWMSIDFLHTYRRTSREVRHLPITEANASWWTVDAQRDTFHGQLSMSISCLLIIFFGVFSVIFTALLPHAIWPYTVLLCIGMAVFVYIFYSLDHYGAFIEAATCATEDISKGHKANHTIRSSKGVLLCVLTLLTFAISCQHVSGERVASINTVVDGQDTCHVAHGQVQEDCHQAQLDSIEQELALKKLQLQNEQLQQRSRFTMGSLVMIMGIIALLVFLVYSSRWSRQLEIKNQQLQRERNVVVAQNKQLAVERDRAEAASRAKTAFIQSMTHEIRTPLNHISGFSQVLAMPGIDLSEEERIDYSQHIQEGTLHLTNILDDLIQISDLESHSELPSTEECYPNLIAAQVTDSIRMMLNDGVEISVQSLVADDFVVNTYPNLLQTALKKLLDNAVKFTQKGSITLTTELNGQELHFSVQDTGPGIPIEKRDYIFERFSKLDSFMQGTGLGLPIARMIAERLNGTLTLDTNYTNGAKFDLIIKI